MPFPNVTNVRVNINTLDLCTSLGCKYTNVDVYNVYRKQKDKRNKKFTGYKIKLTFFSL